MSVQRLRYRPSVAALCGIVMGAIACADNPTGVPDPASGQRPHATADVGSEQVCYVIDGQRYCVDRALTAPDSAGVGP